MLKTKSVYSPIDRKADGLRILATRFRGRGMKSSRYHVWMANLGPSERLLRGGHDWQEFGRRYRREIWESISNDTRNSTIKNHGQKFTLRLLKFLAKRHVVTLMCHCDEDQPHCHRHLLRRLLASNRI